MTTDFNNRPRFLQCAVDGCEDNTASYQDTNTQDPLRYRVPLCDKHKAERDKGTVLLLAPSRVLWFLTGNGPTVVDRLQEATDTLKTEIEALKETRA